MATLFDEYGNPIEMPQADIWGNMSAQVAGMNQMPSVDVMQTPQGPTVSPTGLTTKDLERMQFEAIEAEKQNLLRRQQMQKAAYDNAIQTAQVDYSPLLNLIDSSTGSNLAKGYKAPENISTKQERLNASEDRIQRSREAISDDRMNLLRAKLSQQASMRNSDLQAQILRQKLGEKEAGQRVPATVAADIGEASSSYSAIDDILALTNDNADIMGPMGTGLASSVAGYMQLGDRGKRAASLKSELDTRAQIVGKYLEGGKMTDSDIERYKASIPVMSDSPEVIKTKVANLKRLVAKLQQQKLSSLKGAGYNTSGIPTVEVPELQTSTRTTPASKTAGKKSYDEMTDDELAQALAGGK